jgi:hypothetical protein
MLKAMERINREGKTPGDGSEIVELKGGNYSFKS